MLHGWIAEGEAGEGGWREGHIFRGSEEDRRRTLSPVVKATLQMCTLEHVRVCRMSKRHISAQRLFSTQRELLVVSALQALFGT